MPLAIRNLPRGDPCPPRERIGKPSLGVPPGTIHSPPIERCLPPLLSRTRHEPTISLAKTQSLAVLVGLLMAAVDVLEAQTNGRPVQDPQWAWTTQTPTSTRDLKRIQSTMQARLPAAKRATVTVLGDGSGSGVIVSRSGLVLTAGHVCGNKGSELLVIMADGQPVKATSLGTLEIADAGLVQLSPGRYPHASMAPSKDPAPLGTWCFALGHPGGWDDARGVVVRLGRVISHNRYTLRSDCKLVGGDSGGPLFDLQGRVIAIHSRISKAADQNFHVPVQNYRDFWPEVLAGTMALIPAVDTPSQDSTPAAARTPNAR